MDSREYNIMNSFIDYYDELVDSHLVEDSVGTLDPQEITIINAGMATALTIHKILKEEFLR